MTHLTEWQKVPARVAALVPRALAVQGAYFKFAEEVGDMVGAVATWQPDTDQLTIYRAQPYRTKIAAENVVVRPLTEQRDDPNVIFLKLAGLPYIGSGVDFAQRMMGGATPLTNAIVSSLMLGGLGYGAGTIAENLFPERYIERGKLRRNLGLLGVGAGVAIGANNAYASGRKLGTGFWRGWLARNDQPFPREPHPYPVPEYRLPPKTAPQTRVRFGKTENYNPAPRGDTFSVRPGASTMAMPGDSRHEDAGEFFKMNYDINAVRDMNSRSNSGLFAPTVSVPQFNAAAWNDVQRGMYAGNNMYTPPAYAAAATGLMGGISAAQQSPIIRPVDVIRGIASAGVGLATANIAGRALSALAGLTPAGQEKLQDMGLWGGMMHAIVPSMFGMRR